MSIERKAEYYDKVYLHHPEYGVPYQESPYFDLWQRVMALTPEVEIVELGCGTGQFARMLFDNQKPYKIGYDISVVAVRMAIETNPTFNFKVLDLCKGPIDGDFFIALEIFEHTKDYRIIENIGLGKEIIFTVPDFNDPAHVRYFHSVNEVVERYKNVIRFSHIEKFMSWFICKGVTV